MANEAKAADRQDRDAAQASLPGDTTAGDSAVAGSRTATKRSSSLSSSTTSAGNGLLVREALKPNLSAVEATSQLKVLCRKFAALSEKVKEETKTREEAEKEVWRLRAIVEGNDAPVIASCRAENQAYIRELKEAQEALKHELREEKAKNAMLVSKALELEKEKSALLAAASSASQARAQELSQTTTASDPTVTPYLPKRTSGWDREQATKIHDTLRMTIDELQYELTRKEAELTSNRERLQRERARVKALEGELQEREEASRDEGRVRNELESSIQEQREQFGAMEKEMQIMEQRLSEEGTIRTTLEHQIETLNDVNAALEQRTNALVRRLELSQSLVDEMDELKLQVRDTEVDKETLVRSIKEVKDQHFVKETQWKAQLEQLRSEKLVVAAQISDLQTEIASLRTQNSLYSEWMLVRSDNIAAAQQQQPKQQQQQLLPGGLEGSEVDCQPRAHVRSNRQPQRPHQNSDHYSNTNSRSRVRPLSPSDLGDSIYAHSSTRCPLSPSKTRSMTTASPIKQSPPSWLDASRRTSVSSSSVSSNASEESEKWDQRDNDAGGFRQGMRSGKSTAKERSGARVSTTKHTSKLSDHERLRELMSRNRELQTRLQQETLATRNLEQEITHMTSTRRGASRTESG